MTNILPIKNRKIEPIFSAAVLFAVTTKNLSHTAAEWKNLFGNTPEVNTS